MNIKITHQESEIVYSYGILVKKRGNNNLIVYREMELKVETPNSIEEIEEFSDDI